MRRRLAVLFVALGVIAASCDQFPYVVIENDTSTTVIATASDFPADTAMVETGTSAEMGPLPNKRDTTYLLHTASGELLGCVTAKFRRRDDTATVLVSQVLPCHIGVSGN